MRRLAVLLVMMVINGCSSSVESTAVYETYREFTDRDSQSFDNWIAENAGKFDKNFFDCLTVLEQEWAASSRESLCDTYPPGSPEKAQCYGQHFPSYLLRWGQSLRAKLDRGTPWPQTQIGAEIAQGEAACAVFGAGELCRQFRALIQADSADRQSALVCP
jgi:hypothetical protein